MTEPLHSESISAPIAVRGILAVRVGGIGIAQAGNINYVSGHRTVAAVPAPQWLDGPFGAVFGVKARDHVHGNCNDVRRLLRGAKLVKCSELHASVVEVRDQAQELRTHARPRERKGGVYAHASPRRI